MKSQATTWTIMEGEVLSKFTKVHQSSSWTLLTIFQTLMSQVELPCHPALPLPGPHKDEPLTAPRFLKGKICKLTSQGFLHFWRRASHQNRENVAKLTLRIIKMIKIIQVSRVFEGLCHWKCLHRSHPPVASHQCTVMPSHAESCLYDIYYWFFRTYIV